MVKKVNLKELIIVFFMSLIFLFGTIYSEDIDNVDSMWTFSFSSKLANDYIIYRDYNVVQTPLFAQITAFFLKLIDNTMIISCIVGSLECAFISLFQYLILRKLNINKKASMFVTVIFLLFLSNIACNSYNLLSLLFSYIVLYIEIVKIKYEKYVNLSGKEKSIRLFNISISYILIYNFFTGIFIALTFLAKQTVGAYIVLVITLYYFIQVALKEKTFKKAFIELVEKGIISIIVVLLEMIWLYNNGALYQFIDYTVLGLFNFANKNRGNIISQFFSAKNVSDYIINIFLLTAVLLLPIITFLNIKSYIKSKNKLDNKILILSMLYIIIGIGYSYPLANKYHLDLTKQIVLYLTVINLMCFNGVEKMFGRQMSNKLYKLLIIVVICVGGLNSIISYSFNEGAVYPFKYMNISLEAQNKIIEMKEYIESFEKENNMPIYIIDSKAAKYNLALERNGGLFDLPLYGNLGKEDYNNIINKLKDMNNYAVIILHNEKDIFWQEPKEIREYIINNFEKIDSVIALSGDNDVETSEDKVYLYDVYLKQ